jgi:hypothetical protein
LKAIDPPAENFIIYGKPAADFMNPIKQLVRMSDAQSVLDNSTIIISVAFLVEESAPKKGNRPWSFLKLILGKIVVGNLKIIFVA